VSETARWSLQDEVSFPFLDVNTKADESGWYDVLDPLNLTETCLTTNCDEKLSYSLKI